MAGTASISGTIRDLRGPILASTTAPISGQQTMAMEPSGIVAVSQQQLSRMEQILEYLKALYR